MAKEKEKKETEKTSSSKEEKPVTDKAADKAPEKKKDKKSEKKEQKKKDVKKDEEQLPDDFKYMVRIANTDIDGLKPFYIALSHIQGIGPRTAIIIADHIGFERKKKIGYLTDEQVEQLNNIIDNFPDYCPGWMLNHQNDFETGEDMHFAGPDWRVRVQDDINLMKKIRCYKGIRHETGQKVRGQRTRSNGRSGLTLGVIKKKDEGAKQQSQGGSKK